MVSAEVVSREILQAIILTKDEAPNLARVLDRLAWIERIVIVDSFSTDETATIAKKHLNVDFRQRKFDSHARQWNFGLDLVDSEWVLTLDADYILADEFCEQVRQYIKRNKLTAFNADFRFLVMGHELLNDNTTPRPVLFRPDRCRYFDDGHTQRLEIDGEIGSFSIPILHDDRKPLSRWITNQSGYSIKECRKLLDLPSENATMIEQIRRTKIFAPILVFFYCLFWQRLIFSGWHGWYYTLQRTIVEMLFALRLIEETEFGIKSE